MENRIHTQCFNERTSIIGMSYKGVRRAGRTKGESKAVQRLAHCRVVLPHPGTERPREVVVLIECRGRSPGGTGTTKEGAAEQMFELCRNTAPAEMLPKAERKWGTHLNFSSHTLQTLTNSSPLPNLTRGQFEREPEKCNLLDPASYCTEQSWKRVRNKCDSK